MSNKRRRDSGSGGEDENPPIRIKTEHDLRGYEEEDEFDPPTPPVPRNDPEDVKPQVNGSGSNEISSAANGSGLSSDGYVKSEPVDEKTKEDNGEVEPEEQAQNDQEQPSCSNAHRSQPSIDNFFTLDSNQIEPELPNSHKAEIKHKPVVLPERAHYYNVAPEAELQYGEGPEIKTIPLLKKNGNDSDGSDDEIVENEDDTAGYQIPRGRYFQLSSVYTKYDFSAESRRVDTTRLAVHEKKPQILNSLEKARIIIIEGFTGCGKTTQVPQYILDKCAEDKRVCNIVVTQPRKIAAISVTRRVCYERNWQLGSVVGYQVGMEKKTSKDTLLTFMTTGVLLQRLISDKSLKDYTHIIIDEVHERDLECDFLLLVIKKIMAADTLGKERHVKLILMSATIDTKKFENYFIFEREDGEKIKPHILKVPFVSRHRIQEIYLNDIIQTDLLNSIESNLDLQKATIQEEIYTVAVNCITALDEREREENPDPRLRDRKGLVRWTQSKVRGAVLVFLPGMEEIKAMQRALEETKKKAMDYPENDRRSANFYNWVILPLHSSVSSEDQARVFEPPGDTFRKIILSTNIAESSVTVPDIAYVIDFCLTKSLCVDQATNFTTLKLIWAARSQCVQRKGRTGRVADGKVYRLVPNNFYYTLKENIEPEMQRSSLETVILMCKKFTLGTPLQLLYDALDKPNLSGIQKAIATLKELGALTIELVNPDKVSTRYDTSDGDLTFLGKVMSSLPIPQQCSRLIMFGHCFGVMQETIIIAAALSVKNPYHTAFQRQLHTYLEKMNHANKSFSDLFALYFVYKDWTRKYGEGGDISGNRRYIQEVNWARGAHVHLAVLREIKSTVELLETRLKGLGITDSYSLPPPSAADGDSIGFTQEQGIFLKLAIAGAFYPNYFLRRRPTEVKLYERKNNKDVNGLDVFRTVYFTGFPTGHIGELYAKHIADYLSSGSNVPSVTFENQKVLAQFDNSTGDTIGPFSRGIFRAIKKRQLRESLEFNVLWKEEESHQLECWRHHVRSRRCNPCPNQVGLPPVDASVVSVAVQFIQSPSQFWVLFEHNAPSFRKMEDFILQNLVPIPLPQSKLAPNAFCLAPFENIYYRAKILRVESGGESLVYFVDYGNTKWISSSTLYDFSPAMMENRIHVLPCYAVECRLCEIKPNIVHGLHWSEEAIQQMRNFCNKAPKLELEVYSVVHSRVNCILYGLNADRTQRCSLNDRLKSKDETGKQFGDFAPEVYLSMLNHRQRGRAANMDADEKNSANLEQIGSPLDLDYIVPPRHAKTPVTLKGPWNPLEMHFQALVKCSNTKEVRVDGSSVNSVILDHEPTAPTSRMLVAASVSIIEKSSAVMARNSTIMSAVPGILSLVSMIFAPKIELRVDCNLSKYTGILCGCGTSPTGEPVHPDNDMEIVFDTEIDDEDVDRINNIRYNMNLILRDSRGVNKALFHKQLRDDVVRLLQKRRTSIEEEVWAPEEHVWNRISREFLHTATVPGKSFIHEDIFQPHCKVKLNRMETDEVRWEGGY